MKLFIKIKRTLDHSFLDKAIRTTFNFIYKKKITYFPNSSKFDFENIVIFCYGGMGDTILCFPILTKLSKYFKVHIFLEDKFNDLKNILPENCCVYPYKKESIFSTLFNFRKNKLKKILFIQQSPILELVLFKTIIKAHSSIGFIFSHKNITGINLKLINNQTQIMNKIEGYESIFRELLEISRPKLHINYNTKIRKKFASIDKFSINFKYFTISVSKDPRWEMGGIEPGEFTKALQAICTKTKLTPIFLGSTKDKSRINKMLKLIPSKIKYRNLVGKTDIKELITIINKSEFTIAYDNGIHHLSNFLNKKTLTLFTFSAPIVYSWSKENNFILYKKKYPCMPCVSKPLGPWDNVPFKCPFDIRCEKSLKSDDILHFFSKSKFTISGY